MCRLLGLWAKHEQKKSHRHLMEYWLNAWLDSTKKDHYLNQVYGVPKGQCVHKDGWGLVTLGTDHDCCVKWEHKTQDLDPAFSYRKKSLARLVISSPFLNSAHQILSAHARRASAAMPVTFQQVQPLMIHDDKKSRSIFLSHNGTLNSNILIDMLDAESQEIQAKDFSDTQFLSWYISQKLEDKTNKTSIDDFWIPILQDVIDRHDEEQVNYQMQLIMVEVDENPQLIICSALSEKSHAYMPYYQLFLGKYEDFRVICSSTIVDKYESRYETSKWTLDPIENKTLIHLTSEGEFFFKFK
jgi:predicted glutamine amidotransferase